MWYHSRARLEHAWVICLRYVGCTGWKDVFCAAFCLSALLLLCDSPMWIMITEKNNHSVSGQISCILGCVWNMSIVMGEAGLATRRTGYA